MAARRQPAQTIAGRKRPVPFVTPIAKPNSPAPPSGRQPLIVWITALFVVTLCLSTASPTNAAEPGPLVISLDAMGEEAWHPLSFRSIEKTTDYALSADPDGRPAYRATSNCSASAMLLRLPEDFDLARTPRMAWRWRIENGLDNRREREGAGDDFAARVYVLFRFDPERASLWRRMQDQMGRRLFGAEIPGEAISYVWGSQVSPGIHWTSPSQEDARLLVLESESGGEASRPWREAIVHVADDAARLFDPPPRLQPYAVGLMTDADNTCQTATAWFSDFRLLGPEPTPRPARAAETP